MADMTTAVVKSFGNQPAINMPQPLVNKWANPDVAKVVQAELWALLSADNAPYGSGWAVSPLIGIGAKSAEAAMTQIYPRHKTTTIAAGGNVVTVVAIHATDGSLMPSTTTASMLTDKWASGVTNTMFLADVPAEDDDLLPDIPIVDLALGTRVRVTAKPIGVTLVRPTGMIVGRSKWEGYYLVRLDEPGIYHRGDGTDEPIDEIVEAPDNFAILAQEN